MKPRRVVLWTLLFMIAIIAALTAWSQQQDQLQHQCGFDTEDGTCSNDNDSCVDNHEQCEEWRTKGECDANPVFMLIECRKSCGTCDVTDEEELDSLFETTMELDDEVGRDETPVKKPYIYGPKGISNMNDTDIILSLGVGSSMPQEQQQHQCGFETEDEACSDDNDSCVDNHEQCEEWRTKGECDANPAYMLIECRKSCGTCDVTDEEELDALIERTMELYEVGGDETLLETPYGVRQIVDPDDAERVLEVIRNFTFYMDHLIFTNPKYTAVKKTCKNRHPECSVWATSGECKVNPDYMQKHCAPVCETCHVLDHKYRCPLNETEPEALKPGDLNKMFVRILHDEYYQQYEPAAWSMPNPTDAQKDLGIIDGPWVIVFENFLTFEECDRLIELGAIEGYEVSSDVGRKNFDGTFDSNVNSGRTSTNAWCTTTCYEDDVAKRVSARIENVTGIPEPNAEYLQLLRYEPGQFYNTHHDYISHDIEWPAGVRTLTFFLYLNDVDAGGGTEFPILGFTVQPKTGRAVIWPSVLNENPNAKDDRTEHGALPVEEGIKYGANAWIHQKDVKAALAVGCA